MVSVKVTVTTYAEGGKVNYNEAVVYREDVDAMIIYSI
jgi:hypothetical protein